MIIGTSGIRSTEYIESGTKVVSVKARDCVVDRRGVEIEYSVDFTCSISQDWIEASTKPSIINKQLQLFDDLDQVIIIFNTLPPNRSNML